jgi:hypothetical protein
MDILLAGYKIHTYGSVPTIATTGNVPTHTGQPPWSKHGPNMAETLPKHGPNGGQNMVPKCSDRGPIIAQMLPKHDPNIAET